MDELMLASSTYLYVSSADIFILSVHCMCRLQGRNLPLSQRRQRMLSINFFKGRQTLESSESVANFFNQFSVFTEISSFEIGFSAKRFPESTEGTSLDEGTGTSMVGVGWTTDL